MIWENTNKTRFCLEVWVCFREWVGGGGRVLFDGDSPFIILNNVR